MSDRRQAPLNPNATEFVPRRGFYGRTHNHYLASYAEFRDAYCRDPAIRVDLTVDKNFRDRLTEQLTKEKYECMVCCEAIRVAHAIWSCNLCFHVFHLHCIRRWATKSCDTDGWRCPGCQNRTEDIPTESKCFCGGERNPMRWRPGQFYSAHSCGEPCKRSRKDNCVHRCPLICHPGPCEPCAAIVTRNCECGKTQSKVRCESSAEIKCSSTCNKFMNCGVHKCEKICCSRCESCKVEVKQGCYCGKNTRIVACTLETVGKEFYECSEQCEKLFICGVHKCSRMCHAGPCDAECPMSPNIVFKCPCGKCDLSSMNCAERTFCSDPVPTCDNLCLKPLGCGNSDNPHVCMSKCHEGVCSPCEGTTERTCRCGKSENEVPCKSLWLYNASNPVLCERRCHKKKCCKRHKCSNICCNDTEHICGLICGTTLNCGVHTCELLCHTGKCPPCRIVSFDELRCECRAEVIYPPVPCGTKPPACRKPCTRSHSCGHPVRHNCHSEPQCPPCTDLTTKECFGKHTVRGNIPCHVNDVSCGLPCSKELPCGQHKCIRTCHGGQCFSTPFVCEQLCQQLRPTCLHPCSNTCHGSTPCPATICKFTMDLRCPCGNRTSRMQCFAVSKLIEEKNNSKGVPSSPVNETTKNDDNIKISAQRSVCLECDGECARILRNRKLAEALDIKDAGTSVAADPIYTDFLKEFYNSNPQFVLQVEKELCNLVELSKNSPIQSRSHVFAPMNRDERKFIHEYAAYFSIQTVSYDAEPKRNVVTTAKKNVAEVPVKLLSATMQKNRLAAVKLFRPVQLP